MTLGVKMLPKYETQNTHFVVIHHWKSKRLTVYTISVALGGLHIKKSSLHFQGQDTLLKQDSEDMSWRSDQKVFSLEASFQCTSSLYAKCQDMEATDQQL